MDNFFDEIDRLNLEKSELCMFGRFCRSFLEMAPVITEKLFPYFEKSIESESFKGNVIALYTENHEREKQQILIKIKERSSCSNTLAFYNPQLTQVNKKLSVKTFHELLAHLESEVVEYPGMLGIFDNSYKNIHGREDKNYIRENYINYYIGSLLYGEYASRKAKVSVLENKYSKNVLMQYEQIGIDIKKEDNQFLKYNLLSLNDSIRIVNDKDSQTITDERIDKYFWIDIPRKLLFSIEELLEKKYISDISFRIDFVSEYIPAMEEMEFGSLLNLDVSKLPDLSKFYTAENYENNLWVRHDKVKEQITFEELLEDFEIIDENIVTQVVHLEYCRNGDEYFISHLDHEFIVYTIDEYQERQSNPEVKGHKKVKTFKIDNSKIPFNYKKNGEFFLFQVLDAYLKNTELVEEYFDKI